MSVRLTAGASLAFVAATVLSLAVANGQDQVAGAWEHVEFSRTVLPANGEDPTGLHSAGEVAEAAAGAENVALLSSTVETREGPLTLSILTGNACGMQDCYVKFALGDGTSAHDAPEFGTAICQDFEAVEIDPNAMTLKACGVETDIGAALAGQ